MIIAQDIKTEAVLKFISPKKIGQRSVFLLGPRTFNYISCPTESAPTVNNEVVHLE